MPPKKQSQEEKEKAFDIYKESEEYKQFFNFINAKDENPESKALEMSTDDIYSDWTKFLGEWFRMMEVMKVPKKSKGK